MVVWWGRLRPTAASSSRSVVIAARCARAARRLRNQQDRPDRPDPAYTSRLRRDRAVISVIAVIALITVTVIAGIVLSGPVRAARTVAKGAVSPVTVVTAGRLCRDRRAGRDRRDPPRSSRSYDGHGPTTGAVTAVTVAGEAPITPLSP
jgi:hypothetical protein